MSFLLWLFIFVEASSQDHQDCPTSFKGKRDFVIYKDKHNGSVYTVKTLEATRSLMQTPISLETPLNGETDITFKDSLPDKTATPEEQATAQDISLKISSVVEDLSLKPVDKMILYDRLMSDSPLTSESIGLVFGITHQAVSKREKRLVRKLREGLLPIYEDYFGIESGIESPDQ